MLCDALYDFDPPTIHINDMQAGCILDVIVDINTFEGREIRKLDMVNLGILQEYSASFRKIKNIYCRHKSQFYRKPVCHRAREIS